MQQASADTKLIYILKTIGGMASKAITVGVGIPMIAVGALMAIFWPPLEPEFAATIEFVGSLIGILGVVFFIAGLFYTKEPIMH